MLLRPMPSSTILVTGFGAFERVDENPSGALAQVLAADPGLATRELPVTFRGSADALDEGLTEAPGPVSAILCMGVHPGPSFRLERRARATLSSDRPDNDGEAGAVISGAMGGGGADLETRFELEALAEALRAAGAAEVELSEDAGGYVCERIYRHALVRGEERGIPALFLHVPPLAAVPLDHQLAVVRGLLEALRAQLR